MSTNLRRRKSLKIKFIVYILFLAALSSSFFFLDSSIFSKGPLFISPIGKASVDEASVKRILKSNNISFSSVVFSENSYMINIPNNGQVRLSKDKDIGKQISSLQRILNQLTIEGKLFKNIDFRFSEPMVSF